MNNSINNKINPSLQIYTPNSYLLQKNCDILRKHSIDNRIIQIIDEYVISPSITLCMPASTRHAGCNLSIPSDDALNYWNPPRHRWVVIAATTFTTAFIMNADSSDFQKFRTDLANSENFSCVHYYRLKHGTLFRENEPLHPYGSYTTSTIPKDIDNLVLADTEGNSPEIQVARMKVCLTIFNIYLQTLTFLNEELIHYFKLLINGCDPAQFEEEKPENKLLNLQIDKMLYLFVDRNMNPNLNDRTLDEKRGALQRFSQLFEIILPNNTSLFRRKLLNLFIFHPLNDLIMLNLEECLFFCKKSIISAQFIDNAGPIESAMAVANSLHFKFKETDPNGVINFLKNDLKNYPYDIAGHLLLAAMVNVVSVVQGEGREYLWRAFQMANNVLISKLYPSATIIYVFSQSKIDIHQLYTEENMQFIERFVKEAQPIFYSLDETKNSSSQRPPSPLPQKLPGAPQKPSKVIPKPL